MTALTRATVEALLADMEQIHKPNHGVIAELCRRWLAVEDAPTASIRHNDDGLPELDPRSYEDMRRISANEGQRVRLVVVE